MSDQRLEGLHPAFREIVAEVLRRAPERGIYPFVTQGARSPEYQACLYAQGRLAIGKTAVYSGFTVRAALSNDGRSVLASSGAASNVVPLKRWSAKVTQVGPFGSWHTLRLAADFSFRTSAGVRDDMIAEYERSIAAARAGGDTRFAAALYGRIDRAYESLAAVFDSVEPAVIWGNDWDDDGIVNGPDPDNEWTDLPHFEWHPGLPSIKAIEPEQRNAILDGRLPVRKTTPAAAPADPKCTGVR